MRLQGNPFGLPVARIKEETENQFGGVDKLIWGQKSDSKVRVAKQHYLGEYTALFDFADLGMDEPQIEGIDEFVGTTLILAHAFNRETGAFHVYLGRSRSPEQWGDGPWHWRRLIVTGGTGGGSGVPIPSGPNLPGTAPDANVEDAPVKLKPFEGDGTSVPVGA